jgi:hypothetical protein
VLPTDCAPGYSCIGGECVYGGDCFYGPCPEGYVCDTRGTCVPVATVTCDEDADCELGYCDLDTSRCVRTGLCASDDDCDVYGESFVCDERGICVPDRGPCPDGSCGCANDGECRGVGPGGADWLCESGTCRDPAALCVFNYQCPAGSVCLDSLCRVDCSGGAGCPAGQICESGACVDDADGGGLCTYSSECAGGVCVNGYCIVACTTGTECAAFEGCQSGLCLPQVVRLAACAGEADCPGDPACIDGACRMPCAVDGNCPGTGVAGLTRCVGGYCRAPHEVDGDCSRGADCAGGSCLDGACR